MTTSEAQKIWAAYNGLTNPSHKEQETYVEALNFLITRSSNPDCMNDLGAYYYDQRNFDLAVKYYEMAAQLGNITALSNLGYIWYYGRTGEKNYEKAFQCFHKAARLGDIASAYKEADMYKNGFYVKKDLNKYQSIIEKLYDRLQDGDLYLSDPLPEIYTRLAKIRVAEGKTAEALELYDTARAFLAQRLQIQAFWGDLNTMKWIIQDIYKLRKFDSSHMDLYDLYYLLQTPQHLSFRFEGKKHDL